MKIFKDEDVEVHYSETIAECKECGYPNVDFNVIIGYGDDILEHGRISATTVYAFRCYDCGHNMVVLDEIFNDILYCGEENPDELYDKEYITHIDCLCGERVHIYSDRPDLRKWEEHVSTHNDEYVLLDSVELAKSVKWLYE